MSDTAHTRRIGILCPMPIELRPVVRALGLRPDPADTSLYRGRHGGAAIVATRTGVGTARAGAATERLLAHGPFNIVYVVGIAGGVDLDLEIADLINPEVVVDGATGETFRPHPWMAQPQKGSLVTGDELIVDVDRIAQQRADGVVALDMETASVGRVCEQRGQRWSAVRSISDRAGTILDESVMTMLNPDGSTKLGSALAHLATHPQKIPFLVRLGTDSRKATMAAAKGVTQAIVRS
jgi:adenosylhomocysteine nucleosidase